MESGAYPRWVPASTSRVSPVTWRDAVEARKTAAAAMSSAVEAAFSGVDAAVLLFIGTIQGLVIQAMVAGEVARASRDAPGVFAIYRRGIRGDRR